MKPIKQILTDFVYGRRRVSGKVHDGSLIKGEYVEHGNVDASLNVQVEVELNQNFNHQEVCVSIRHGSDILGDLYLTQGEAEKLAYALLDPLKG